MSTDSLSKAEIEVATELFNVSLGSSSTALSTLFSETVSMKNLQLQVVHKENLFSTLESPFFAILGEYSGGFSGAQMLTINDQDVQKISNNETDSQMQAIQKMTEQMFTAVSQSMTTLLEQEVSYSLSGIDRVEQKSALSVDNFIQGDVLVEASFQLEIGEQNIIVHLYLPIQLMKQLIKSVNDSIGVTEPLKKEPSEQISEPFSEPAQPSNQEAHTNIQPVQFSSFDETAATQVEPNNLDMLLDIPLQVTVELGRTKRMVKEILEVSQGSIIELDKLAGEPVDILINNKLIAVGEVVVIDENFGVRVTDILSTAERISKLR